MARAAPAVAVSRSWLPARKRCRRTGSHLPRTAGRRTGCRSEGPMQKRSAVPTMAARHRTAERVNRASAARSAGIAVAPAAPPVATAPSTSALLGGRTGAASFGSIELSQRSREIPRLALAHGLAQGENKNTGQHLRSIAVGAGLPQANWHRNLHRGARQTLCQCTDLLSGAALAT